MQNCCINFNEVTWPNCYHHSQLVYILGYSGFVPYDDDGSWWWFQTHCSESRAHFKGSVLALTLVAGRLFPGSLSPGLLLAIACTITYLTRWKERGTIRFIPELVHNLASALALRAPLIRAVAHNTILKGQLRVSWLFWKHQNKFIYTRLDHLVYPMLLCLGRSDYIWSYQTKTNKLF